MDAVECTRCNGTGEIAVNNKTLRYVCSGPVPDDAKNVLPVCCDRCAGMGYLDELPETE